MNRNGIINEIKNTLASAIKKAGEMMPMVYKDMRGKRHMQCAGAYNDMMGRAMASDMFMLTTLYMNHDLQAVKNASTWSERMNNLNFTVMRMGDDLEGDRPLIPYDFKDAERMMEEMTNLKKKLPDAVPDEKIMNMVKERLDAWVERLYYMDIWAYYLMQLETIDDIRFHASMRMFDEQDNQISGLSEGDEKIVKAICDLRESLLKIFLKLPGSSKEHNLVFEKLGLLEIITQVIMEGKMEQLTAMIEKKV